MGFAALNPSYDSRLPINTTGVLRLAGCASFISRTAAALVIVA